MAANPAAATNNGASEASLKSLFLSLCNLTTFITNSSEALTIRGKLTPAKVSVLSSLLTSQAQISQLTLWEELPPGTAAAIGSAISASTTILSLTLGMDCAFACTPVPKLLRILTVTAANFAALEQLSITCSDIFIECKPDSFVRFAALRDLAITSGSYYSRGGIPPFVAWISKHHALESLTLREIKFRDSDVEALVAGLKTLPMLTNLSIRSAGLRAGRPIGDLVARGKIQKLDLHANDLGDKGVSAMMDAIIASGRGSTLQVLNLGYNCFGPVIGQKATELGAQTVAQFIFVYGGRRLRELRMDRNGVTEVGALALAGAFPKAYALRHIDMAENIIGPRGAAAVMNALAAASTEPMDTILLSSCMIGDDGASAVGRLMIRRRCKHTFLDNNDIHAIGEIADSVAVSAGIIQDLGLSYNPIGDEGIEYILDKIIFTHQQQPQNSVVGDLNIIKTSMEIYGARAVKRAVEAQGALGRLRVTEHTGYEKADNIIRDVRRWEHTSRPAGTAILSFW